MTRAAVGMPARSATRGGRAHRGVVSTALLLLLPAALLFAGRAAVAEPFRIPSASMSPTLDPGDHVVAGKLAYLVGTPRVGELAVFESPRDGSVLVKRIVALGAQEVEIRDGVLWVDRRRRREPYVDQSRVDGFFFGPVRVPGGAVFVLGDNRGDSEDSRRLGAIPRDRLIGRVELRIWPPARAGRPPLER